MWKTTLKLLAQVIIARFLRNRMQQTEDHMISDTQNNFNAVKKSLTALIENHAVLFKNQINEDINRVFNSFLGLLFIFFALLCSGLTALMWLFATAWDSQNRHIILGTTMILPIIIAIGVFILIRLNWKKQPLFAKSMVQIENDWHVFKNGLDGTADTSDEANR